MHIANKRETLILFLGDIVLFLFALWLTLFVRYFEIPDSEILLTHLQPFSLLFFVWIVSFFIAGLYEKHTLIIKNKLPVVIFNTQAVNSLIAVLFFYLIPYFGIAPKTNLFIYLIISFILISLWRIFGISLFGFRSKQKAILIGSGKETRELKDEVNNNSRYNLQFVSSVDLDEMEGIDFRQEILNRIYSDDISIIVVDLKNEKIGPILPKLYNLLFSKIVFVDQHKVYEDLFDRVPISLVGYNWFLENISSSTHLAYDFLKRFMDIVIAFVVGTLSLILYPFVYLAIKIDDGGPVFAVLERVGKDNQLIKMLKFRTMTAVEQGEWKGKGLRNKVTRVGRFLRASRIDELPQLWNVLSGKISLIGPRPEFAEPVNHYKKEVPYYNVRHLIKPGLSGWAQIYHENAPHHSLDVSETKVKLSYDLYYIKNRSFLLDLKIALKTVKALVSRTGI